jgi:hypothetical protein
MSSRRQRLAVPAAPATNEPAAPPAPAAADGALASDAPAKAAKPSEEPAETVPAPANL